MNPGNGSTQVDDAFEKTFASDWTDPRMKWPIMAWPELRGFTQVRLYPRSTYIREIPLGFTRNTSECCWVGGTDPNLVTA